MVSNAQQRATIYKSPQLCERPNRRAYPATVVAIPRSVPTEKRSYALEPPKRLVPRASKRPPRVATVAPAQLRALKLRLSPSIGRLRVRITTM